MDSHAKPSKIDELNLSDEAQALITDDALWQVRFFAQILQETNGVESDNQSYEKVDEPAQWGAKYLEDLTNISHVLASALQKGFGAIGDDELPQFEQCSMLVNYANEIGLVQNRLLELLHRLELVLSDPAMIEPYLFRFENPTRHLINEIDNLPKNLNVAIQEFEAIPEDSRPANLPLTFQFPDFSL